MFILTSTFMHQEGDVDRYRNLFFVVVLTYMLLMEAIFFLIYFLNKRKGKKPFFIITIITAVIILIILVQNKGFVYGADANIVKYTFFSNENYYIISGVVSKWYSYSTLVFYGSSIIYFIWMVIGSDVRKSTFRYQIQLYVIILFLIGNFYDVLIDIEIIKNSVYISEYTIILSILLFNLDLINDIYKGNKDREKFIILSQNFNKLIQEIRLYVIGFDEYKNINFINKYATEVFGKGIVKKQLSSLLTIESEDTTSDLTIFHTNDRLKKYIKSSIITLNTQDNVQSYIIGYDITERKKEQKKLKSTLLELHKLTEELEQENTILKVASRNNNKPNELFVGSFASSIEEEVKRIANYKSTVLIEGANGTGKKYVADLIIQASNRVNKPSVVYNCHQSIKSIFQTQYYGNSSHKQANDRSILNVVNNGSLILSDIENMSETDQELLLSLLKDNDSESLKYDIRFIITTTKDLKQLVREGSFNMELYQYLSIYSIHIPELKNRLSDIPYLTATFVAQFCERHNIHKLSISVASIKKLQSYNWPGNIKEFRYILQKAVLASKGKTLKLTGFEEYKKEQEKKNSTILTLEEFERKYILDILDLSKWKVSGKNSASEYLGINEATLRSKMKKLSIAKNKKM
ncbi:sigma-54-dependent transcriptional regulator [Flammeovirga kamogawensis]|uniref:Sigma 54-interacting transcriptional regulator n=1 Tax=Flammeovirga kamogawensis TaxID=373891 RepID=A0ABX8GT73_9BACT|nr:sigma 54-interacting transcriptional regulator [Flammeovirga kamogawensis]MBB6462550.1 DNA-binding NtrC family response regulator [Flammeovirga kamogawensis]QWG06716.1 sigma 54-interacting transcriptional regulator [Flammeovirga kamogawensis]